MTQTDSATPLPRHDPDLEPAFVRRCAAHGRHPNVQCEGATLAPPRAHSLRATPRLRMTSDSRRNCSVRSALQWRAGPAISRPTGPCAPTKAETRAYPGVRSAELALKRFIRRRRREPTRRCLLGNAVRLSDQTEPDAGSLIVMWCDCQVPGIDATGTMGRADIAFALMSRGSVLAAIIVSELRQGCGCGATTATNLRRKLPHRPDGISINVNEHKRIVIPADARKDSGSAGGSKFARMW